MSSIVIVMMMERMFNIITDFTVISGAITTQHFEEEEKVIYINFLPLAKEDKFCNLNWDL